MNSNPINIYLALDLFAQNGVTFATLPFAYCFLWSEVWNINYV